jgi:hypothetical protein
MNIIKSLHYTVHTRAKLIPTLFLHKLTRFNVLINCRYHFHQTKLTLACKVETFFIDLFFFHKKTFF